MRTIRGVAGAVALVAGLAACGDSAEDEAAAAALEQQMQPGPVDTPTAAALAGELVDATVSEWAIQLSRSEMPAGQITFRVRNTGQLEHDFEIEEAVDGGAGQDWEIEGEIPPGEERLLNVTLVPGAYELYCETDSEQGNHDELGERVRFTVR